MRKSATPFPSKQSRNFRNVDTPKFPSFRDSDYSADDSSSLDSPPRNPAGGITVAPTSSATAMMSDAESDDFIPPTQDQTWSFNKRRRLLNADASDGTAVSDGENVLPAPTVKAENKKKSSMASSYIQFPKRIKNWRDHPRQNPAKATLPKVGAESSIIVEKVNSKTIVTNVSIASSTKVAIEWSSEEASDHGKDANSPTHKRRPISPEPDVQNVKNAVKEPLTSKQTTPDFKIPKVVRISKPLTSRKRTKSKPASPHIKTQMIAEIMKPLSDITNTAKTPVRQASESPQSPKRNLRRRLSNVSYRDSSPPASDYGDGWVRYELHLESDESQSEKKKQSPKMPIRTYQRRKLPTGDPNVISKPEKRMRATFFGQAKQKTRVSKMDDAITRRKIEKPKVPNLLDLPRGKRAASVQFFPKVAHTSNKRIREKEILRDCISSPQDNLHLSAGELDHSLMTIPNAESTRCFNNAGGNCAEKKAAEVGDVPNVRGVALEETPRTRAHATPANATNKILLPTEILNCLENSLDMRDVETMTDALMHPSNSFLCEMLKRKLSVDVIIREELGRMIKKEYYELCAAKARNFDINFET